MRLMQAWSDFTESLSAQGGTIALLFVCCVGLATLVIHIMHHNYGGEAATVIIATFSAFTGALLTMLTGRGKTNTSSTATSENGNVAVSTTTTEVKK